jgi:hypothetical protein
MDTEIRLNFNRRISFADGHAFGEVGAYERLTGTVSFALDPEEPSNSNIVDLEYAPRNSNGLVEFKADLDILKPIDLSKGNRRILYDVINRGTRTALTHFNDAPRTPDPMTLEDAGNGFLMRQGYTIVFSGWQGDLLPGQELLTADLPEAVKDGESLEGVVRQEFIANEEGVLSIPLSGHKVIRCYEPIHQETATLTYREFEADQRQLVPRNEWSFASITTDLAGNIKIIPSTTHLLIQPMFRPGYIYELIYSTQGSRVMGLGVIGIRDLLSFLKYEETDANNAPNPLVGGIDKAYTYGMSLSSRVVRQFIYDGYNVDPLGRKVFDAAYPHVSGAGRLFTNIRFAQVGRYPRQHEEHQWPAERYPFAYSVIPDPFTDNLDSVLRRPESDPLVMHTHTNTEYWQRYASLGHTDPRNGEDLEMPSNVRMYVIASAQHGGSHTLSEGDFSQQLPNRMSTGPILRAMLTLMDKWATDGTAPPVSRIPLRMENTLDWADSILARFPRIPGFNLPSSPSRLVKYNYGPEFNAGHITEHPPSSVPNQEYRLQLPEVDSDGNDIAGIRTPEIEAPVGTHTGWSLRKAGVAEGDLFSLTGSFLPFARTQKEREVNNDPRLSIEERYPSHEVYVKAIGNAAYKLVEEGMLLLEDAERYIQAAKERNPLDSNVPLLPLTLK